MKYLLLVVITTLLAIAGTVSVLPHIAQTKAATTQTQTAEPAYQRVMKSGTIRCGYGTGEPWLYIDPNSKKVIGLGADVINAIAKKLSLKVEWTEEIGWNHINLGLDNNRFDVGCSSLWITGNRGREMLFTNAYAYSPLYVYAREGETRFTSYESANNPEITFTVVDADISALFKKRFFPEAKAESLVATATPSDVYISVTTKKADAVIAEPMSIGAFNQHNSPKLVPISNKPLVAYGAAYPVAKGEYKLKNMLDVALYDLKTSGELATIIKKYNDKYPGSLLPPKVGY